MARLIEKLSDYAKGKSIYLSDLGDSIEIPGEVLKKLNHIQTLTKNDGRERALNIYYAYGEIITTDHTIGTDERVQTNDKISVKFDHYKADYYYKVIEINGKVYFKNKTTVAEINKLDRSVLSIMNFHTHPLHAEYNFKTWGFFSDIDLTSFTQNKALPSIGLLTKSIWLLVKLKPNLTLNIREYSELYHSLYNEEIPNYQPLIDYLTINGIAVYFSEGSGVLKKR